MKNMISLNGAILKFCISNEYNFLKWCRDCGIKIEKINGDIFLDGDRASKLMKNYKIEVINKIEEEIEAILKTN